MTEMLRQSLSAAIDDEADAFELRRVLDELDRDPELRAAWERYHLIGSALRGERRLVRSDLRERIWMALDGAAADPEAPPSAGAVAGPAGEPAARSGRRRYAALAVAASVAFAVVVGSTFFGTGPDTDVPAVAGVELTTPAVAVAQAGGHAGATSDIPRPRQAAEVPAPDLQRAHAYMLHHTQQQAMNQSSVMSLVKLATYEAP